MKTIVNTVILPGLLLCGVIAWFAFKTISQETPTSTLISAPSGTTIKVTNTNALDYSNYYYYPDHEIKVTFYGRRYSDGQGVWDPSSPFIGVGCGGWTEPFYCLCENFYYCDGEADIYTGQDNAHAWVYQGYMLMSSSNCIMDGQKVTLFTVNCQYLDNPE
jgi:hypothetical protein